MSQVVDAWNCFLFEERNELTLKGSALDCYSIEYLVSNLNDLRKVDNGAAKLLKSVNLIECCFIDQYAVRAMIGFLIAIGTDLKRLCLEFGGPRHQPVQVNQLSMSSLLHMLQSIPSLESLRFRDIDMEGRRHLQSLLSNPVCKIRELEFRDCRLGAEEINGLVEGLEAMPIGLELLEITESGGGYGVENTRSGERLLRLVRVITNCPTKDTLRVLRLRMFQCIRKTGLPVFASILRLCPRLEELDLYWCKELLRHIRPEDPHYLMFVEALGQSKTIRAVNLHMCGMTNLLAVPFFQALEGNTSIRELRLGIMVTLHTDRLSNSLANSLPNIPGLQLLHANIDIRSPHVKKALKSNSTLTDIDYYDDAEISRLLRRNKLIAMACRCLERRDKLSLASWSSCMEELNDSSAMYVFLTASMNELVSPPKVGTVGQFM